MSQFVEFLKESSNRGYEILVSEPDVDDGTVQLMATVTLNNKEQFAKLKTIVQEATKMAFDDFDGKRMSILS